MLSAFIRLYPPFILPVLLFNRLLHQTANQNDARRHIIHVAHAIVFTLA